MRELLRRLASQPDAAGRMLVASFLIGVLALAQPLFVTQVLNRYLAHGVDATLTTLTVGVLVAVVVELALREIRLKMAAASMAGADAALSRAVFAVLTGARASALERVPAAERGQLSRNLDLVQSAYSAPNIASVLDIPFAVISLVILLATSVWLWLITVLAIAVAVALTLGIQRALAEPARRHAETAGEAAALAAMAGNAADTVRAFTAAERLRSQWASTGAELQRLSHALTARRGHSQSATQTVTAVMSIAIIAVGALLVVNGDLSSGALMGINILAARTLAPISRLAAMGEPLAKAEQAMTSLREFARLPLEPTRGTALAEYGGRLELVDVAFAHAGGSTPLFEHLNLTLQPGDVAAVMGENGAGKTTLARLLAGLIDPSRGAILADGVDLRQMAPEWWRRQLVYLPQEPSFLNGTLADTLTSLVPELDEGRRTAVIARAGLRRFVDALPQGLDTPLRDLGRGLSVGIRRRLALARALTTDGRLVIIDEPAEGLDAEGCAALRAAVLELAARGRTVVLFAHDPAAIAALGLPGGPRWLVDLSAKPVPRLMERTAAQAPQPQPQSAQAQQQQPQPAGAS